MSKLRKYGTCFFEQYAQITLSALLGHEFDSLVNLDRPDLQTPDSPAIGIEVTRAMEESKNAATQMLKDISGISLTREDDGDLERIQDSGYAWGLQGGRYIGANELEYWSLALPLRRIIESKVAKVGNGFYGQFNKMGLYVFCKDMLSEGEVLKTCHYTRGLQKYLDIKYNRLYLSEAGSLYVCNLDDGLSESSRIMRIPISREQRKDFYLDAVSRQIEKN